MLLDLTHEDALGDGNGGLQGSGVRVRGRLSTWISLFLGSPAAVSVWGCLGGDLSARRWQWWAEPMGRRGGKSLSPLPAAAQEAASAPFSFSLGECE